MTPEEKKVANEAKAKAKAELVEENKAKDEAKAKAKAEAKAELEAEEKAKKEAKAEAKKEAAAKKGKGMDSKGMLKKAGKAERKIKFGERMDLIVIEASKFHKKGQRITPHTVMGEQLIIDGIAAKYTKELAKEIEAEIAATITKK